MSDVALDSGDGAMFTDQSTRQQLNKVVEDLGGVKADLRNVTQLLHASDRKAQESRSRVYSQLSRLEGRIGNVEADVKEINNLKPFIYKMKRIFWAMMGVIIAASILTPEILQGLGNMLQQLANI